VTRSTGLLLVVGFLLHPATVHRAAAVVTGVVAVAAMPASTWRREAMTDSSLELLA
jgi:hypothetical protein